MEPWSVTRCHCQNLSSSAPKMRRSTRPRRGYSVSRHNHISVAHLLTILQIGIQGSSPELLAVDREINILQYCLFSKHVVSRTSFSHVFFPFRWPSMFSSHISIGLPRGLVPFVFNFTITLSVDSFLFPHDMTKPPKFVLVDYLNNE